MILLSAPLLLAAASGAAASAAAALHCKLLLRDVWWAGNALWDSKLCRHDADLAATCNVVGKDPWPRKACHAVPG